MFAIRGLLATTIKPFLGKFVKRGMQTDTSNGLSITNIEIREDSLETLLSKLLPQMATRIQHASVGSVDVDISWSSARIKWEGVLIGAEILNKSDQFVTPETPLGSSLIAEHSLSMSESGSESLFNSALLGAQKRIEGAVSLIFHTFDCITVHLKVSERVLLEIILNEVEFNENSGLSIKTFTVSKLRTNENDVLVAKVDMIAMDREFKSVSSEDALINLDLLQEIIQSVSYTSASDTFSSPPVSLHASVTKTATLLYEKKVFKAIGSQATVNEKCVEFTCREFMVTHDNVAKNVKGTFHFGLTPEEDNEKTSPFDEGKLFMFRSHIRPVSIAHQDRLNTFFKSNRDSVRQRIVIECSHLSVKDTILDTVDTESSGSSKKFTALIEIKVIGVADLLFKEQSVNVTGLSVFLNLGEQSSWYVSADVISAGRFVSLNQVKVAGNSLEHISADVGYCDIIDPDQAHKIIQTLIDNSVAGDHVSFFVRIQRGRIAPSKWYDSSDISIGMCDVFTIGDVGDFALTAGTIYSAYIRLNAVQAEKSNNVYRFHASLVHMLLSPIELTNMIGIATKLSKRPDIISPEDKKAFRLDDHLMIKDYVNQIREDVSSGSDETIFKISVTKTQVQLSQNRPDSYAELNIDGLKARIQPHRKRITFDLLQCLDKTSRSSFNKAIVIRGATITRSDKEDYGIVFGEPSNAGKGRMEDVSLAIDQTFLDYVISFCKAVIFPESEPTKVFKIRSIRISEIKMRINYRPSGEGSEMEIGVMKWMPIKEAVIKLKQFDEFDLTFDELSVALGMHFMKDKKNLARLFGGVKPIRVPVEIFKNVTELILIPIHPVSPEYSNDVKGRLAQMRHISSKTIVSVLEIVPPSKQQPSGIKQGIVQAGQTFQRDMNTIVAFVSGDNANVDLLDVPMMIVRPFTSLITGVCNQLDPIRLERLRNKYR